MICIHLLAVYIDSMHEIILLNNNAKLLLNVGFTLTYIVAFSKNMWSSSVGNIMLFFNFAINDLLCSGCYLSLPCNFVV